MWKAGRALAGALVLLAGFTAPLQAQRGSLPPLTLAAGGGAAAEVTSLEGPWLLVVVQPRCAPCDVVLRELDRDERPGAARIAIVGSGLDQEAIGALAGKYPNLAASRWYADPGRGTRDALQLKAAPAVLGLRGAQIEWRLVGSVEDPRELESILFSWLEKK